MCHSNGSLFFRKNANTWLAFYTKISLNMGLFKFPKFWSVCIRNDAKCVQGTLLTKPNLRLPMYPYQACKKKKKKKRGFRNIKVI